MKADQNIIFPHAFCVAPMLDWTDRHCRVFFRSLSTHAFLYTEMMTTGALLHGNSRKHLLFSPIEKPLALQLGGSDPFALAECVRLAAPYAYDEINLNVGCPSSRVQNGRFGACLMAEPSLVAECVIAMREATSLPVTVKTRIGIDEEDSYEALYRFIEKVAKAGCKLFIIHARKAWLKGLSPKENREIPPLRYEIVRQLKNDFPQLQFILNGGIDSVSVAKEHTNFFPGVMLGRAVYHNPYLLAEVDHQFYKQEDNLLTRKEVLLKYMPYVKQQLQEGVPLSALARPLMGLFLGLPGARVWRRYLSEHIHLPGATEAVIVEAEKYMNKSTVI